MQKTVETIGDATGQTGWRKTFPKKWTPPAQVCGAWRRKVEQTPDQIMQSALDAFGEQSQVDMVLEEGFELGKALLKLRRKKGTVDDVIDEIADGFVTLGQMRLLYGPEAVDARIKVKLARLVRLVADQVKANAEKTKPVKPALRWEADGADLTLYDGEAVGWVSWWPALAKWMGNPYGKTAMPCGAKSDAKRHVEMACGFDEVPLWTP